MGNQSPGCCDHLTWWHGSFFDGGAALINLSRLFSLWFLNDLFTSMNSTQSHALLHSTITTGTYRFWAFVLASSQIYGLVYLFILYWTQSSFVLAKSFSCLFKFPNVDYSWNFLYTFRLVDSCWLISEKLLRFLKVPWNFSEILFDLNL